MKKQSQRKQQYYSKRNKFAKQIRKQQKQRYFNFQRQTNYGQIPLMAYIPALLQQQAYTQLQQILDGIMIEDYQHTQFYSNKTTAHIQTNNLCINNHILPTKLLQNIIQRQKNHVEQNVRILMLKLLNRIGLWNEDHYHRSLQYLQKCQQTIQNQQLIKNYQSMLKQIAIHIQRNKQKINAQEVYNKQLNLALQNITHIKVINSQYKVFWIHIVQEGLALHDIQAKQLANILLQQSLFNNLDLQNQQQAYHNQFMYVRFINICDRLITLYEGTDTTRFIAINIVSLQCFNNFIDLLVSGSIDVVIQGLSLLAQLYSSSDQAIKQCYKNNIQKIHQRYLDHILDDVRLNNLWGISNIIGSQYSSIISENRVLMLKLKANFQKQTNNRLIIQYCTCFLNLWCVYNHQQFCHIFMNPQKYANFLQLFQMINQKISPSGAQLLDRYLFAVYNLLQFIKLQNGNNHISLGPVISQLTLTKSVLQNFYYNWKQSSFPKQTLNKIDITLHQLQNIVTQL